RISRLRLQESQVKAQVQIGNLVSPAGAPITTVSTVDPIKAEFTVSEQEYLRFMEAEQQAAPCTVRKIDSNRIHWRSPMNWSRMNGRDRAESRRKTSSPHCKTARGWHTSVTRAALIRC